MQDNDVVNQLHPTEARWFAVHTRAKAEKAVLRLLQKKGIQAYVPLQRLVRQYSRSRRLTEIPLIYGYVFVCITQPQYLAVLETEHVSGFVRFHKSLLAIPEEEITLLRRITLEEDLLLEAVPGALTEGDPVEISAGNLTGLRGKIVRKAGKQLFQVVLERLGYSLLLTVDAAFLRKTDARAP